MTKFLADENISSNLVNFLKQGGYAITTVSECQLAGKPDIQIIHHAFENEMVILTHDSDFGTIAVNGGEKFYSIMYLRPGHIDYMYHVEMLNAGFAELTEIIPGMIIVLQRSGGEVRIRIRILQFPQE